MHGPVLPIQPPRRARSDVGDSRAVDSTHGGRGGIDEPTPGNGHAADSPPAGGEGNKVLSEDSFYRVAVQKIMEKERLDDTGIGDAHGDGGGAGGVGVGGGGSSGGVAKSGGIRSSGRRRPRDEARKGAADAMVFGSPRGAMAGRQGRRKVKQTCDVLLNRVSKATAVCNMSRIETAHR